MNVYFLWYTGSDPELGEWRRQAKEVARMEDILTTLARQFLPQMEPEERAEALRSLKRMIDEELFNMALGEQPERAETSCPRCGSRHVDKKGREPDGSQRYLCRSCTRTFTSRTNKVFATTKLDRATWMRFA
jgi:hypothetical protein